jgi:hypothetical protein
MSESDTATCTCLVCGTTGPMRTHRTKHFTPGKDVPPNGVDPSTQVISCVVCGTQEMHLYPDEGGRSWVARPKDAP